MAEASTSTYSGQLRLLTKNTDIYMAVAVVGILVFMVIPMPAFMLDLLLSFSITFSLVILLVAMYIMKPLDLSAFPSILLLLTLFRLSLNVATTRVILLHGQDGTMAAGKVIQAFGNFVVGGNYVVGIIVFAILVVINFAVITKGAGRIAEVAARFTLDAMPGKQMSIDADLNAGIISDEEAIARREEISREAEYYGSMDGANKFVRGDAIAGIIITLINILGGFAIGVFQNDMSFADAAQTYTLLTVGDGLVSQIPALIISTAAGIIVTRAGTESRLGEEITTQIMFQPRAIAMAGAVLFGFAIIPGLPTVPFLTLAVICGVLAFIVFQSGREAQQQALLEEDLPDSEDAQDQIDVLPPLDALGIEIGYSLIPLVDAEQDGELLSRVKSIRRQMAQEIGLLLPPVHIQDNMQLKPGQYAIMLKGNEVAGGELMSNYFLAMNPGTAEGRLDGIPTSEPTYGLPATWIKASAKDEAIAQGYTVVDLATILTTHLSEVVRRHCHELIGRQEVQKLLDSVKQSHPKVVEELVPNLLSLGGVVKVLQNLLREQVPIRDMLAILETLADWAPVTKDFDILTERVRQALARTLTKIYQTPEGIVPVVTLGHAVEQTFSEAIQQTDQGTFIALNPEIANKIMTDLSGKLEQMAGLNYQPLVMCSSQIRPHFKKLVDRFIPQVGVLSYEEILSTVEIQSIGAVEMSDAN
jgi:flagellar biosynthesis protein FlhA